MANMISSNITITRWIQAADLRNVSWMAGKVKRLANKHKLLQGQAVLFSNRACTRFRILVNLDGMNVVMIPPGANGRGARALYMQVARWITNSMSARAAITSSLKNVAGAQRVVTRRLKAI